jgi:uncharacterized repeat protein (TIGR01451 family)
MSPNVYAQTPGINWQRTIGGSGNDYDYDLGTRLLTSTDGDFLCLGITNSNDGDVKVRIGFNDILLVRYSKDGVKRWSKNYGHSFCSANIGGFSQTSDGGFIIVCNFPGYLMDQKGHINILKTDSSGTLQWETSYPNTLGMDGAGIYQTPDNGYLMCASNMHIWLMRLDSAGHKVSEQFYGGIATGADEPYTISRTIDGGFAIAGYSNSTDGDFQGYSSAAKAFLLKVNSNGVKEWIKGYAGEYAFYAIVQDSMGNYYSGGNAIIEKMNNSGNVIWKKSFSGSFLGIINSITLTKDNGLAFCGYTQSSDGDFSTNVYKGRFWVGKVSQNDGTLAFQTFFGGNSEANTAEGIVQLEDEGLIVLGKTDNTNPFLLNYRGGQTDIWLIKLGAINTIKGSLFLDVNGNGIKDAGENPVDLGKIKVSKNKGDSVLLLPFNGNFIWDVDTGNYATTLVLDNPYYSIANNVRHSVFNNYYNTDSFSFPLVPIPGKTDLNVNLIPLTPARATSVLQYKLVYKNVGTEPVHSVSIRLVTDNRLALPVSIPAPATSVNGVYTWNIASLNPLDTGSIAMYFKSPNPTSLKQGDTLQFLAVILPDANDITPADDTSFLKQLIVSSYDPNGKTEANAGAITSAQVASGAYLNYTIRFQNTGTDTAFNVILRDTLESRLDLNTFQIISASHPYRCFIEDNNRLTWQFNNIHLPDSNVNEPLSHGYVTYRVRPKNTVEVGDTIHNTAAIYFDFNSPVSTNIERTVVLKYTPPRGSIPLPDANSLIYPNPSQGQITVKLHGAITGNIYLKIFNQWGQEVFSKIITKPSDNDLETTLNLAELPKGNYILKVRTVNKSYLHELLLL